MGPHIILPLAEPDDPTQHIPRVDTHTHADVHSCGLTHLPGAEQPVTYSSSGPQQRSWAWQGFLFREAKNPIPGSVQAHTQLKGV